jgi:hypothetical protein
MLVKINLKLGVVYKHPTKGMDIEIGISTSTKTLKEKMVNKFRGNTSLTE